MTADRAFSLRVARLAATSAVALGALWALARAEHAGPTIRYLLAGGWVSMPAILVASLRRPRLRYALVVPSTLVTVALIGLIATVRPLDGIARAGWMLITSGVLTGGVLGLWFWFRLMPVPLALNDPFSRSRWTLIAIHVALVVSGLVLVSVNVVGGR